MAAIWLTVSGYVVIPKLAGWPEYGFIPGYAVCTIVHSTEAMKITPYCIVVAFFFLLLYHWELQHFPTTRFSRL